MALPEATGFRIQGAIFLRVGRAVFTAWQDTLAVRSPLYMSKARDTVSHTP
jgi:hypothetical protein